MGKTKIKVFLISDESLLKENGCNSTKGNDIDMKLVPVTNLVKRNKITSKNLAMMPCQETGMSLSLFQFLASLE